MIANRGLKYYQINCSFACFYLSVDKKTQIESLLSNLFIIITHWKECCCINWNSS